MSRRPATLLEVAPFTMGTIVICVATFVLLLSKTPSGANGMSIPIDVLNAYGASWREGVWDGEWYRFLAPMFLHVNLVHILMNMYALYSMGPGAEIHFGTKRFAMIYLLSGIGGTCLSMIFGGHLAAGASGSIFGIMGAYLATQVMVCYDFRRALKSSEVRRAAFYILINFGICLMIPNVDHWGHAGGLLLGFLYGALFEYQRNHRRIGVAFLATCVLLTAGLVASCRWMVFNPHYYVHLGLKADEQGRTAEADAQFAKAREWAKVFRSGPAGYELWEHSRGVAKRLQSVDSAAANEIRLLQRYAALFLDVTPEKQDDPLRVFMTQIRDAPITAWGQESKTE